jgi:glycosyltransferase involved in cell wall biosynthesis
MRILYVTPYYKPAYAYGGPVRSTSELCEAMTAQGAEVTVLTTHANAGEPLPVALREPLTVDGVQVVYYPVSDLPPRSFFYSPELAAACAQNAGRYDLAILDTFYTHAMGPAANACACDGVPFIMPLRGQLLPWALGYKRLKKWLYWRAAGRRYLNAAAALHCTDAAEAEAAARLGLRTRTFVVPNGIEACRFEQLPPHGGLRQRLGIPADARVLLFLGRLHRKKRPDIAVSALAAAQALPGETHLVLAGPDEEQLATDLRAQAHAVGCAERLHFTGLLAGDHVLQALADSDLLLMPSAPDSENFGMAAAEALAAGLPVLTSDRVPVGRAAQAAGAGCVAPADAEAFSQMTLKMLGTPERMAEMGPRGRELVRREYDLPAVGRRMLAQCWAIVETGRPLPDGASGESLALES